MFHATRLTPLRPSTNNTVIWTKIIHDTRLIFSLFHDTRLIFWMFHATRLTPLRPSSNTENYRRIFLKGKHDAPIVWKTIKTIGAPGTIAGSHTIALVVWKSVSALSSAVSKIPNSDNSWVRQQTFGARFTYKTRTDQFSFFHIGRMNGECCCVYDRPDRPGRRTITQVVFPYDHPIVWTYFEITIIIIKNLYTGSRHYL